MINIKSLAITIATAVSVGGMPTAIAQTDTPEAAIPYEITFNGSYYPINLETVEYPYTAASQQLDGECQLNVIADSADNLAGITIVSCTDSAFRNAATRYINAQSFTQDSATNLTSHTLNIKWDIGEELEQSAPLQVASR